MSDKYQAVTEQQIEQEMAALSKVFDVVRLLSADEVGAKTESCEKKRILGKCYEIWNRSAPCRDCSSYRALTEKGQFAKIEKTADGVFHVLSVYVEVDGKPCVMELVKKFDDDMTVSVDVEKPVETFDEYFVKTYTDVLTETYNRRYYEEFLSNETMSGCVAMMDLDDFKIYNDLFGHDVGDMLLKAVASTIKSCVRTEDKVVRYGGDEFLLVVQGISKSAFDRCLRDVRRQVKKIYFEQYPAIKPSVSTGFSAFYPDEPIKNAVSRADEYMYLAKKEKKLAENTHEVTSGGAIRNQYVLVVDDSDMNREIVATILRNEYEIIEAANGEEAVAKINAYGTDIAVVLLDMVMPHMNGFEVLDYMNAQNLIGEIPVIAITGEGSGESMRTAYEKGVSDYIVRPFDAKIVYRRVSNTVKMYAKQKQLIAEVKREVNNNEKNRSMLVEILSQIIERPNSDDGGKHAEHMMRFTELILETLVKKKAGYRFEPQDIYTISSAAALHDIGKSQIDSKILDKKGRLTPEEFEIIKTHTVLGEKLLNNIKVYSREPLLKYAKKICRHHHERYDGNGYPDGLKGDDIPIVAQVVSVCDVYDALVSKRPYKPAYSHEDALAMIHDGQCGAFNPLLLQCLDECAEEMKKIVNKS